MRKLTKVIMLLIVLMLVSGFILLRGFGGVEAPRQPIEFDHWQHVTKEEGPQLECSFCHENADKSRYATVPNISTCMACHESIETDRPEVQKLAAIAERNEQPAWSRIYWIENSANVFFTHKPHIRAGLDCSACHGQVGQMHRLKREAELSMGWCVACHRQQRASIDCYACHR
jgi:uncharacterized protein YgiB involved in biofilm formation